MFGRLGVALLVILAAATMSLAQTARSLSPRGTASVHVKGQWVKPAQQAFTMGGERYQGGQWIDIEYGRPLLRGRTAFSGSGETYGKETYAGAPVWRAGADVSTRLKAPVPLRFGSTVVPAGEYSLFIELNSPTNWTLIVSNWAAATRFNPPISEGLFGAFNYTPEKDVVRTPMAVSAVPWKIEQLTWMFTDMTDTGGAMTIMWDKSTASARFSF
jgi:hypothetical protein